MIMYTCRPSYGAFYFSHTNLCWDMFIFICTATLKVAWLITWPIKLNLWVLLRIGKFLNWEIWRNFRNTAFSPCITIKGCSLQCSLSSGSLIKRSFTVSEICISTLLYYYHSINIRNMYYYYHSIGPGRPMWVGCMPYLTCYMLCGD